MKIAIIGITGRMGQAILAAAEDYNNITILGGYAKDTNTDLNAIIQSADAIIDFSAPELSLQAIAIAAEHKKIYVCGTTGFTNEEFELFKTIGHTTTTLWASNMSIGVNVLNILAEQAAKMLKNYDAEIVEMHHRNKKDSPSGTAITLGKHIAKARGVNFDKVAVKSREGITTEIRNRDEIGFATLRGGSVIGDHSAIFAGNNDTITISHHAQDRSIFASGAIDAAIWCQNKSHGFYSIQDMLTNF